MEQNTNTPSTKKRSLSPLAIVLLLSGGFFFLFVAISSALFFRNSNDWENSSSPGIFSGTDGLVGVIEISDVIMDSKKVIKVLQRFEKNDRIKGVVLRLDTPGGAVAPSQEIYEAVKKFPKPLVSSMGSVAASGGYYIAVGTQKIFANPGTLTGSIGVIMQFADLSKIYDWAKVHRYSITSGPFKDAGADYRKMSAEEKALFQRMVDDIHMQFKKAVSEGRKLPMKEVNRLADGRVYSGSQAFEQKLVDQLGSLDDAVAEVGKMAKISGKPKVVYPRLPKKSFMEFLMDHSPDDESRSFSDGVLGHFLKNVLVDSLRTVLGLDSSVGSVDSLSPGVYWIWNGAR